MTKAHWSYLDFATKPRCYGCPHFTSLIILFRKINSSPASWGHTGLVKDGALQRPLPSPQSLWTQSPPAPLCAQLSWLLSSSVQTYEHPLSWVTMLERAGNLLVFRTTGVWKWTETLLGFHTNTASTLWQQAKPSLFLHSFFPGSLSCSLEKSFFGWLEQWAVFSQWFSFLNEPLCGCLKIKF